MSGKIADIEVITLRYEYPPGKGFYFSGGYCSGRLSCLVRVQTDDGIEGVGSVYSHPGLVRAIIEEHLRDMLVGEDADDIEGLWKKAYVVTRWYGRRGVAISALGGIDVALWDIRGKKAGRPIHRLLNSNHDTLPVYASALLWQDNLAELERQAEAHLAKGFRAMKMRLGRNYVYDCSAMEMVHNVIGPKNRLMIEGNTRYSLEQALHLAPELRRHQIYWFEEPFPPEEPEKLLELRRSLRVPLAAGENEFGLQGFRELIDSGVVDIVQPDCSRAGGLTECRRIALWASAKGFHVATHTWSDAVALVANMHLLASLPNGLMVEFDRTGNALIDELLAEPLRISDGEVSLPKGPGLGISLNSDALKRYTWPRTAPIPPGNYSDLVFGRAGYTPAAPYDGQPA